MFATSQRPTLAQSITDPSFLKSLFTVSSTAVSTAVGFLSITTSTLVGLPSHAQEIQVMGEYLLPEATQIYSGHIYTASDVAQLGIDNSWTEPNLYLNIAPQGGGAVTGAGGRRLDPIDSPHPLPWSWIVEIQSRMLEPSTSQMFYYRSPALASPDGDYSAYTRMQVLRVAEPHQSQVSSLLFLENMETGSLQFLTATSPEMQHILLQGADSQQPGMLSMLMPISWSEEGDRVLVRAFESIFSTDIAADYAIIWHRASNQVEHVIPTSAQYSNAVLLGWSQTYPGQILFQVGNLGDESWPLMAMSEAGDYHMVAADEPITYGQTTATFWNGPQASAFE